MFSILLLFLVLTSRITAQENAQPQPPPQPQPQPPPPPQPQPNQTKPEDPPEPDFKAKPTTPQWPGPYSENGSTRHILADWLINGNWGDSFKPKPNNNHYEYPGYDGFYNNLARTDSGAIDRPLLRRWPAAYKDGSYEPSGYDRPNPFDLSDKLLSGDIGQRSKNGKNALFLFFGQQVVEEILDAQRPACPPEYINIKIPKGHKYRKHHTEMPVLRTRYDMRTGYSPNNPRQQLNEITPYLDGGLFYGITKQWSDQLRTYSNGTLDQYGLLASSHGGLFPEYNTHRLPMANPPPPFYHAHYTNVHETAKVDRFFKLGNPRGNENAFLLTFGVMWFRWHNYLAKRIRHHNPNWSGEKIYNEARKWVIATQQRIVLYEWLPVLLGKEFPAYRKYNPGIDPQIDQFFQSAAFRFGHTLVVPGVYLRDYTRKSCNRQFNSWKHPAVRTCNIFWRPQEPMLNKTNEGDLIDIDRLLMGMSVQLTEREDHTIVEDLRGNVFGPLEFPRRDLMAINIQRGRDHGLPDFNSARRAFGLKPYKGFADFKFITNDTIREELKTLYDNDINKIDPWVGGILETDTGPGELFERVITDQFKRIRDGDRFWYENTENGLFIDDEIRRINLLSIYDVIMAVTKMEENDIPKKPFRAPKVETDKALIDTCHLTEVAEQNFYHLPQLNSILLNENCTQPAKYDYFSNSEASFIITFLVLGAFIVGTIGVVFLLIRLKEYNMLQVSAAINKTKRATIGRESHIHYPLFIVNEWVGKKYPVRKVALVLQSDKRQICINCHNGTLLRALDFKDGNLKVKLILTTDEPTLILQCRHNYDLVLKFESNYLRDHFCKEFNSALVSTRIIETQIISSLNWNAALKIVVTKDDRQKRLEMFFRVVFAQAFKIEHSRNEILKVDAYVAREVVDTELTLSEFADSLSMKADNEFVKRMFFLIDKDKNGFISFREFVDLLIIFANGTEEEKAKLLFDMYDIDGIGQLKQEDFIVMIKSFLETVGGKIEDTDIQKTVEHMLKNAGIDHKKNNLTFEDFKRMIGNDIKNLNTATLGFKGVKKQDRGSYLQTAKNTIENIYESKQEIESRFVGHNDQSSNLSKIIDDDQEEMIKIQVRSFSDTKQNPVLRYIELKSKEIFWMTLYTLVLLAIFAERAYYYTVEREHSGLRRIAGYGVTITRGAASAMMFTYASLLVTMCRNTITFLRDTMANNYFPFDASVEMHKYIALWAFIFTLLHIIGHAFNFYHISTQTADDLTCLFRNFFHSTHELPKFHYWCWQTMTGFTGVILTLIFAVMYTFALPVIRRKIYNWFWYTHSLYPLFFIFFILHGTGRLIQAPFTYYFLLGPVILFTVDTLVSVSRKKIEIPVINADILPSNVTRLEFRKPDYFQYKAGQWVRIACLALNKHEYHPFTLSSAPDEDTLTVHIRSVGPWTMHIRSIYDTVSRAETKLPKIYLDGPYGEGHQDWSTYDVAILIGGGIGVTPFASILKDVSYSAKKIRTHCQKVYFIWVSRTQKQFEWLVDIIRDVETNDTKNFVSCHIFITQFYEKFDLRTILLYICERHYQRVSNRSLFTNLRAVTHFGRPQFSHFFKTVKYIHESAQRVGVFSCGPPSMTTAVDLACSAINQQSEQRFEHHFKNF